jgi:predicted AlkP superfamily phosphohydrolase/phosphomutase
MIEHLNWTKEEFKAFLLLYAAQTNFIETQEEIEYIESRFPNEIINKIRKEINKLNDYQKSEIIVNQIKSNEYVQSDLDEILVEIKELYKSDGVFDSLEQSIFSMLNRLLKIN